MILLDTNVLVYAINADAVQHTASRAVVEAAIQGNVPGVLVPQVLLEFFAVVTHPRRLVHPLDSPRAWAEAQTLRASLPVLDVQPEALTVLNGLVQTMRPGGRHIFDVFLVAQMRTHSVATICTCNIEDFAGFAGITAMTPEDVLARLDPT